MHPFEMDAAIAKRGFTIELARIFTRHTPARVAYVAQARHIPGLVHRMPPRVEPVAAAPGCLDGWQGPAVLDPALPSDLRAALAPRVADLNRPVEALRYLSQCHRGHRPVAPIAR